MRARAVAKTGCFLLRVTGFKLVSLQLPLSPYMDAVKSIKQLESLFFRNMLRCT